MTPYTKKIVELHKIHKAIEDKDCNGGENTPIHDSGSIMLIEMEPKNAVGSYKPKTIPSQFTSEAEYFDYVWDKVSNGEVALYFKYQQANLESTSKDVVIPVSIATSYFLEGFLENGTLAWFRVEEE